MISAVRREAGARITNKIKRLAQHFPTGESAMFEFLQISLISGFDGTTVCRDFSQVRELCEEPASLQPVSRRISPR